MSERMVDECAKAICTTMDLDDKEPCARLCTGCKIAARAVLTCLREPTPGMVAAGWETIRRRQPMGPAFRSPGPALKEAFRAMIDAAMEGK